MTEERALTLTFSRDHYRKSESYISSFRQATSKISNGAEAKFRLSQIKLAKINNQKNTTPGWYEEVYILLATYYEKMRTKFYISC